MGIARTNMTIARTIAKTLTALDAAACAGDIEAAKVKLALAKECERILSQYSDKYPTDPPTPITFWLSPERQKELTRLMYAVSATSDEPCDLSDLVSELLSETTHEEECMWRGVSAAIDAAH